MDGSSHYCVADQQRGDRYLIGWQIKNYRKTELGVSSLQVELNKFTSYLSGQRRNCKGGVFVIVLNGKGDEMVERFRGKVITSEDMEAIDALGLTLPSNVQVVIPTLQQLEKFLGEEALETLSKQILMTDDRHRKTFARIWRESSSRSAALSVLGENERWFCRGMELRNCSRLEGVHGVLEDD
jgi:hypothetical protein